MLKNYFVTSIRNLLHHKTLAFIYLSGLSIGVAASMLILIWVHFQLSFDKSTPDAQDIYRVYPHILVHGNNFTSAMAPPPLRDLLRREFPKVKAATRFYKYNTNAVSREENGKPVKAFNEEVYQADSAFFSVFKFRMLQGDPVRCLSKPSSVVLTKSTAIKYFGKPAFEAGTILGKSLHVNISGWKLVCEITGITEDVPANAHFHYNIILSDATDSWTGSQVWVDNTYYTYIVLKKGADARNVERKIPAAVKSHLEPQLQANFGTSFAQMKSGGDYWEYKLQPITDIHLHSSLERELEPGENISNVYILGMAAILLLCMACINYANLSTVNAIKRSKEIGVRKTLGSSRVKVMQLIFTETGMISLAAWILAAVLILMARPYFESLMRTKVPWEAVFSPANWMIFVALLFVISFFGGIYPAFYLSSINAVKAIKGRSTPGRRFIRFKSILVIAQFFMCIGLVICALLVRQQLQFLRDKSPGFNKENVLLLSDPGVKLGGNPESFLSELKRNPDILSASVCGDYPNSGNDNFPISANYRMGTPDYLIANFSAGYDFLKTFGIKLLEGRDFDRQLDNDTVRRVILNAAAVKELGMGNPVNRFINTRYLNSLDIKTVRYQVIGVSADFNFKSLHKTIQPMAIFLRNWGQYIAIRLSGNSIRHTIGYIEKEWQSFVPGAAFEYHFMDERIDRLYKTEAVLSNILLILTGLIVLVAVMGLAGLTLLTVQQRTKEIGIRKVVGASVGDIVFLFSRDYARWIGVSFVLAASVAWFVMHRWLLGFAYRIDISWWVFAVSGLAAALMAFAIIGAQVTRAAGVSPVKSLRAE